MKRFCATSLVVVLLLVSVFSCTGCFTALLKKAPKNWYEDSVEFYREGLNTGWANDDPEYRLNISKDLKDPYNKEIGYLLVDLDKDGVQEFLVGFNDGSTATKFTDVLVWHSDLGAYKLLGGGEGYYIYLCADNVLAVDSWYGSQTQREFMRWDSKQNAFPVIDGEGKYLPKKWDLTKF